MKTIRESLNSEAKIRRKIMKINFKRDKIDIFTKMINNKISTIHICKDVDVLKELYHQ